jgi:ABC-2 type transport system permease protein
MGRDMRWGHILTFAGKDWRLFWADRRAATLCFLVPIILASAFGVIFDRPHHANAAIRLPILLIVESDSPFVSRLVHDLTQSPRLEVHHHDRAGAESRIAERHPGVAVVLTADLESLTVMHLGHSAYRPRLEILHHPLCATESQWAEGVVTEVVLRSLAKHQLGTTIVSPFQTQHTIVGGATHTQFNAYSHSFCGMTLQYLLFWGMESGLLLLRERQRSVWQRLRSSPISLTAILLGKGFSTASIALLQVLVTFAFGYFVFNVTIGGSPIGFVLLALTISCLSAATGLLVAAIGGTEARARSFCILVILGVSMLGGLWLPAFLLPGWVRDVALSLPTTWAMRGLDGVTWQGHDLGMSLPSIAMVLGFTGLFLTIAVARFVTHEARRRRGVMV